MDNSQILDHFGRKIIDRILDRYYKSVPMEIEFGTQNPNRIHYYSMFQKMDKDDKVLLSKYINILLESIIYDFLNFFEESEEFKLIYKSGDTEVNLAEISEMLKAELIIEGGWIDRFSKYGRIESHDPNTEGES